MAKKEKKKKPIFEKVGLVFRSPIRTEILREISEIPQKPKKIAENIGVQKQNLNYHLNALKRGGLIQTHKEELSEIDLQIEKGTRINGINESGKIQVSYGVELTKNGKNIVNQFINPLYEEKITKKNESKREKNKNNIKEDE